VPEGNLALLGMKGKEGKNAHSRVGRDSYFGSRRMNKKLGNRYKSLIFFINHFFRKQTLFDASRGLSGQAPKEGILLSGPRDPETFVHGVHA